MQGKVLKFPVRYPDNSTQQEWGWSERAELLHLVAESLKSFTEQAHVLAEKTAALVDANAKAQSIMQELTKERIGPLTQDKNP